VPVSRIEARGIRQVIEELPEPRRTEVRARFTETLARLEEAGMLEDLRHVDRMGREVIDLALRYFGLGIRCPFLEDESCSIYADRPIACREHLVTSDPAHCDDAASPQIRGVHLPAKVSRVVDRYECDVPPDKFPGIPLVLAPEWADAHPEPDPAAERPGPDLLRDFFRMLAAQ
jgi:Fe-S-cluster containining protein